MLRDDDDIDDNFNNASMLQVKQQITNNVTMKRKEQLQRWESSEMNGEPEVRRKKARVQFQDSDIFLSACMSGDEDEVDDLLSKGADINTSTVDGLTALHQSVIDSKPEMVRFLCDKSADVNAQDNEGWTPLHAAACCGNLSIVKYLCNNGADLQIINSDKELPLDLADDESCREFLEQEYERRGIDPEECRDQELGTMMRDAHKWLADGTFADRPHPRTGASAIHVAAAKGYTQLLELLIRAGGNVKAQDKDGWTPLHAAAHWAERDSCKILMEHGARVSDTNFAGLNVLTVADKNIYEYLEELDRVVAERKKSPSIQAAVGILQEKNIRVSHEEHTMTTDHKRELQHKDQSSENEVLFKVPKLSEKSPSIESQSSEESKASSPMEEERSPSLESQVKASDNDYLPSARSSADRVVSERNSVSMERSDKSMSAESSNSAASRSSTGSGSSMVSTSVTPSSGSYMSTGSSNRSTTVSSLQSGDQHVSATVPMPRPLQQPASSWINRGVQLVTRSTSASRSPSLSAEPSASSQTPSTTSSSTAAGSSSAEVSGPSTPVLSKPPFIVSPVQRSSSTPSSLPWISLCRATGNNSSTSNMSGTIPVNSPVSATTGQLSTSPSSPLTPVLLGQNRLSAFRPPVKNSTSSTVTELPRGMHWQPMSQQKMRPWQSNAVNESEAERRTTARLQRQNRRSTQGVTKEQLEEARLAAEGRRASQAAANAVSVASSGTAQREQMVARLASEERDSTSMSSLDRCDSEDRGPARLSANGLRISQDKDADRSSVERFSPTTSATFSLPNTTAIAPGSTPSATALRRKSQGMPLSRSNRRGTGPVLAEDVQAAIRPSTTVPTSSVTDSSLLNSSGRQMVSTLSRPIMTSYSRPDSSYSRFSGSSTTRSDRSSDKSMSAPPTNQPTNGSSSVLGLRSAAIAPTTGSRVVPPRTTVQQFNSSSYAQSPSLSSRPVETNLNYKALYEKEKSESERLRKELDDFKRAQEGSSVSAFRSISSRFRNGSSNSTSNMALPLSKSASGASMDDSERRSLERKIADLEIQIKEQTSLSEDNVRLRSENEALVRVLAKLSRPPASPSTAIF